MTFSVMTWNVENLFPPGTMQGSDKRIISSEYHAKLDYLSEVLLKEKPDVVALQELGYRKNRKKQSIDDLQSRLEDHYPYTACSKYPDSRGIYVGFLSRIGILSDTDDEANHAINFPADCELCQVPDWEGKHLVRMGRGALMVDIEPIDDFHIRLVTCHLKSKLITYPAGSSSSRFSPKDENERTIGESLALFRRTAEAATIRMFINGPMQEQPDTHTIVLGDLNDEPGAATTQQILGPADRDVTSADKLDQFRLYNLLDAIPSKGKRTKIFLPPEERCSRIYNDRWELIDHILVSKGLLGTTSDLKKDVWRVREVRCLAEGITSISDNPGDRIGESIPDHAPVMATFDLR